MPKFRKKPIIVEAVQWFPGKEVEGVIERVTYGYIETGSYIVDAGDWVITRTTGERYPCKDAIFRATYEPIGED